MKLSLKTRIFLLSPVFIAIVFIASSFEVKAAPLACIPPPSDMIAWFPGEDNFTDVITGEDASVNNVSFTNGKVGRAFYLDSLYDRSSGYAKPISGITDRFTLDTWVNIPRTPYDLGYQRFVSLQGPDWRVGPESAIRLDSDRAAFFVWTTDGLKYITDPQQFTYDRFVHVTGVFNGAQGYMQLYIDGSLVGSVSMPAGTSMGSKLDRTAGSPTEVLVGIIESMYGIIDEPMVFSRALSADEVLAISGAGSAGVCRVVPDDECSDSHGKGKKTFSKHKNCHDKNR